MNGRSTKKVNNKPLCSMINTNLPEHKKIIYVKQQKSIKRAIILRYLSRRICKDKFYPKLCRILDFIFPFDKSLFKIGSKYGDNYQNSFEEGQQENLSKNGTITSNNRLSEEVD